MNKKSLFAITSVALITGALFLTKSISAQESDTAVPSLMAKIAAKFNLNQSEVQTVFNEFHTERQQERMSQVETRLAQAVTDGKISQNQKQAILTKIKEMQAMREPGSMKELSLEERQALMETKHVDMDTWLKTQGLTLETYHDLVGMGAGKGMGGRGHGMRMMQTNTRTVTN